MPFKLLSSIILIICFTFIFIPCAEAATCRNLDGHSICILRIKRSAKYYWEYRAAVSIDGKKKPIEIYNCRDRTKIRQDKNIVPFANNGAGELICSLFSQ